MLAALGAACLLLGCGSGGGAGADAAADNVLVVYNWADFIGKDTLAKFHERTGITVIYDTYEAEMTLEARLLAGGSGYDVVFPSMDYVARQIAAGVYAPLDRSRLPHFQNLDPDVLRVFRRADPGNRYAVPYLHSVTGFAYNVERIRARMPDAPVDSLAMLFDPKVVARFADCGVAFLDSAQDVLALALNYLHLDPATARAEDFSAAERLLAAVRPYVRTFDSAGQINQLAGDELCIAMTWSGDYAISMARARAAGVDVHLEFTVPKEGANISYTGILIPRDAAHPALAHRFIDFLLEPEIIAAISNELYYGNDNRAARALVRPEILANAAIYPTPALGARLFQADMGTPATERLRTRTWTRVRTQH